MLHGDWFRSEGLSEATDLKFQTLSCGDCRAQRKKINILDSAYVAFIHPCDLHFGPFALRIIAFRTITLRTLTLRTITFRTITLRTIILRISTLRFLTLRTTLRTITLQTVTLRPVTLRTITFRTITLWTITLRAITLWTITLWTITLRTSTLRFLTLRTVTLWPITLRTFTLRTFTLRAITLRTTALRTTMSEQDSIIHPCPFPLCTSRSFSQKHSLKNHLGAVIASGYDSKHPINSPLWTSDPVRSMLTGRTRLHNDQLGQRHRANRAKYYRKHREAILERVKLRQQRVNAALRSMAGNSFFAIFIDVWRFTSTDPRFNNVP